MPTRFCTQCWTVQAWTADVCSQCGAPLADPTHNGVPYREKLLDALRNPEPETRARAAMLLGVISEPGDAQVISVLLALLEASVRDARGSDPQGGASKQAGTSLWNSSIVRDNGLQVEAIDALGRLGGCEASNVLFRMAMQDELPLVSGLRSVDALADLALSGCDDAAEALQRLAHEAGRVAVRTEASTVLAALNEPE